ncbi:MAG: CPBP family intramembrane glutamic endopeptidase [Spirochaetia bacterium]|jgi:hypothetical protein
MTALFFSVTSAIAPIVSDPYASLFCCIGVAFVLLSSVLNVHSLKRNAVHDYGPVMLYFASFFVLMFLFPMALVLVEGPRVGMYPWTLGMRLGDWRTGLTFVVVTLPLLALSLALGSKDPELRRAYPFSKEALERPGRFALYEFAYVAFYYLGWEFAFRGVMLFGLLAFLPHTIPGIAVAIMVQTFLSTIYHIGHPHSEVFGAFILGLAAGAATVVTGSILYGLFYHALAGVLNDCLAYRRLARARRLGRTAG